MKNRNELENRLKRARSRRKSDWKETLILIGGLVLVLLVVFLVILGIKSCSRSTTEEEHVDVTQEVAPETRSPEEILEAQKKAVQNAKDNHEAYLDELFAEYTNLALADVDDGGYLNMREEPSTSAEIIGKLYSDAACDIRDTVTNEDGSEWCLVYSGGFQGYVSPKYLITGEEAREKARTLICPRIIITADKLYVRDAADSDANIVSRVYEKERYKILGQENGWYKIDLGYVNGDYVEVRDCLNEARKLDLKSQVLNMYDNLGVSSAQSYLNIRKGPGEKYDIIGKLPGKAGADIIGSENGWYHIKSGKVDGWVSGDYILTGNDAAASALANAELMAIVKTDRLNVRSKPSLDSTVWTQLSNEERYIVLEQLDGWVKLELEEDNNAYASSDYVEVRYALNEAIKYSPLEEAAANSTKKRNSVVSYALQFLGNPYVWGGTSLTNGCDCSGFTMKVMANFGVSLPHYSGDQAKMGKKVTSDTMKPGDLIFYANSSGVINHVAIYIGNGQVVHAASRKSGIKISKWNYRSPKAIRNVLD